MNALGNILWLILGGILVALMYYAAGILLCITIIGIPFGFQLFKLGTYALWPAVLHYHRRDSLWRAALQAGLVLDLPLREGYRSQK